MLKFSAYTIAVNKATNGQTDHITQENDENLKTSLNVSEYERIIYRFLPHGDRVFRACKIKCQVALRQPIRAVSEPEGPEYQSQPDVTLVTEM